MNPEGIEMEEIKESEVKVTEEVMCKGDIELEESEVKLREVVVCKGGIEERKRVPVAEVKPIRMLKEEEQEENRNRNMESIEEEAEEEFVDSNCSRRWMWCSFLVLGIVLFVTVVYWVIKELFF